jgi:hypothetical protein
MGFNVQDAKGRLESLIAAHVWDKEYKTADAMPPQIAERHLDRLQRRFDSGHYATKSAGWQEVLMTADGVVLFVLSLLQEHHPDLTPADALAIFSDNPREVKRALRTVAPDFFKAVLRQLGATEAAIESQAADLETLAAQVGEEIEEPTREPATASA